MCRSMEFRDWRLFGALLLVSGSSTLLLEAARPIVPGWSASPQADDYALSVDHVNVHGGKSSIAVQSKPGAAAGSHVAIGQRIKADEFRGKRVRLRGYVKTSNVTGKARLWMRIDGPQGVLGIDSMHGKPLQGSREWHRIDLVLDVPEQSVGISFGMRLSGLGQVWLDDVAFSTVGPEVAVTQPGNGVSSAHKLTAEQIQRTLTGYSEAPARPTNLGFETAMPAAAEDH